MLVGVFRPVILLPPVNTADDELAFILRHELIHFKRHDLWYKALILAAAALHWFNPVVYLMAGAAALQCEISCDALVLQGADFEKRRQYGETIIGVVRNGVKFRTALSTHFYGGKKGMKSRISSIMDTNRKRTGIAVLCIVLAVIMATGVPLAAAETGDSVTGGINIQDGQISTDGGLTWMDAEEYEKTHPAWRADFVQSVRARAQERLESMEWLVQEEIRLQLLGRSLEGLYGRIEERIDNIVQRVERQPEWKEWSEEDKIRLRQKIDNGIQKLEFKWPETERPEQEYIRPRERTPRVRITR
jgi:hypothetical protein